MRAGLVLAMLSSLCFGIALVTGRIGLRTLDARSGAAISIPTAAVLFLLAAPFAFDGGSFTPVAALLFAVVGLFFPALVTLLTFRSNERLGPTITASVSGTAPLFALLAAGWLLGEKVPAQAALACVLVAVGIAVLSWKPHSAHPGVAGWSVLWALAGAVVRGLAQAGAKAGLMLWPNPFAASLIGYSVSSAIVLGANQVGRAGKPPLTRHGVAWFAVTGAFNGGAVLLMYGALSIAPVSWVAPIVATHPLITALASAVFLRDEPVTLRMAAGMALTVFAVVYLVASGSSA